MAVTLPDSPGTTHLNSVRATAAKPAQDSGGLAILRRVLHELDVKHEVAAMQAGVKPSQWSAALSGHGNFGLTWLWKQEDAVVLRWVELVLEGRGLSLGTARAVRASRIVELIKLLTEES